MMNKTSLEPERNNMLIPEKSDKKNKNEMKFFNTEIKFSSDYNKFIFVTEVYLGK